LTRKKARQIKRKHGFVFLNPEALVMTDSEVTHRDGSG
jgi:hypothetical protein